MANRSSWDQLSQIFDRLFMVQTHGLKMELYVLKLSKDFTLKPAIVSYRVNLNGIPLDCNKLWYLAQLVATKMTSPWLIWPPPDHLPDDRLHANQIIQSDNA